MDAPNSGPNGNNNNNNDSNGIDNNNNNNAVATVDKADKARGRRRRLVGCVVFTTACIAGTCLSVILFLIPFVIDPAISALRYIRIN